MDTETWTGLSTTETWAFSEATIGVSIDVWDQPEAVMPMIDTYAR